MAQPLFDQILKVMAPRWPRQFVCMAFPKTHFKVISSKFDTGLISKTRRVDHVLQKAKPPAKRKSKK